VKKSLSASAQFLRCQIRAGDLLPKNGDISGRLDTKANCVVADVQDLNRGSDGWNEDLFAYTTGEDKHGVASLQR
jgi:hypothetical protein